MTPPCIETERLWLAWPEADQIADYHREILGTHIFDTIVWDGPTSAADLPRYWQAVRTVDWTDPAQDLALAIIERASHRYIGGIALRPDADGPQKASVGYALAPAFHGRGYATEALRAVVDEGFAHRHAERISAEVFVGNHASRRVAEKAGLRLEGTLRRNICKRGVWLDEWLMAITRPDWEQARRAAPTSAPRG
jgi:RimJ/RimL family protein N-acetyltransferase